MAAVLAEGTTRIINAAAEPHIVQLCETLNSMGAEIEGIGSNNLIIHGVNSLNTFEVSIISDMIEAGTFLMAGALLGEIEVKNIIPKHLDKVVHKLSETGCLLKINQNSIIITPPEKIKSVDNFNKIYWEIYRYQTCFVYQRANFNCFQ